MQYLTACSQKIFKQEAWKVKKKKKKVNVSVIFKIKEAQTENVLII